MTLSMESGAWWFCTPPAVEEVRLRLNSVTLEPVGVTLRCAHGSWSDLRTAREAHGFTIDQPQPELA